MVSERCGAEHGVPMTACMYVERDGGKAGEAAGEAAEVAVEAAEAAVECGCECGCGRVAACARADAILGLAVECGGSIPTSVVVHADIEPHPAAGSEPRAAPARRRARTFYNYRG